MSNKVVDIDLSRRVSELPRVRRLSADDQFLVAKQEAGGEADELLRDISAICGDEGAYYGFVRYLAAKAVSDPSFDPIAAEEVLKGVRRYSRCMSYSDLSAQLCASISGFAGLSSMAFHDTWEYSKVWHVHGYTKVKAKPVYRQDDGGRYIGKVVIRSPGKTENISVWSPPPGRTVDAIFEVGEVKLLAVSERKQISYTDPAFDGWVYMDGKSYPKEFFPDAYELYKGLLGSTLTSFVVPTMNRFFTPNPGIYETDAMRKTEWQNRIPRHSHAIDTSQFDNIKFSNLTCNVRLPYDHSGGEAGGKALHVRYQTKIKNSYTPYMTSVDFTGVNAAATKTIISADNQCESYPEHMAIPAMVYIGIPGKGGL